jgi:predicted Zn-dependent peptidase
MLTFVTSDPDRAGRALKIVREEFRRFCDDGATADELTAAKNKLASAAVIGGEVPMGRLTAVGFDWVYRRTYTPLAEQIDTMMAVTADEVLDIARRFDLNDTALLGLGPCAEL